MMITEDRKIGQDEAWELAKKIIKSENNGGFSFSQINEIFGTPDFFEAMIQNSYLEAAAKIKIWEDSKKIKVGDEYLSKTIDEKCIITKIENNTVYILWDDGSCGKRQIDDLKSIYTKTGRTLPIKDWLQQIGEK